jgi:hypothetical protein
MQLGTWGPNVSVPQGVDSTTFDFELEGRVLPDPWAAAHRPLAQRCRVAGPSFRVRQQSLQSNNAFAGHANARQKTVRLPLGDRRLNR